MRTRLVGPILIALLMLLASCGSSSDSVASSGDGDTDCDTLPLHTDGQLTVATGEFVFPPWMEDDDPSNGRGYESAVVYAVAGELGLDNVVWSGTTFDAAYAPGEKDYDFNIQQVSITPERSEVVSFSDSYYSAEQAIIAVEGSSLVGATSFEDLKAARLAAAIGTTSLDYIENEIEPESDASVFDDNAAAKAAFDAKQIDGLVLDLPTAYYVSAVEIEGSSIIGVLPRADGTADELGMVFEKDNPLVPCINAALTTLRDNGTLEDLETQWLNQGGDIPTLTK